MDIYGVIGYPIKHSLSPLMHNAAFEKLGIDAAYLPFEVKPSDLKIVLKGMFKAGIKGLNVTIPHKETCMAMLDEIYCMAEAIGAVNTIVLEEEGLVGYNTDAEGFITSLKEDLHFDPKDKTVFILGSGGASRAVSFGLAENGAREIIITDIFLEKVSAISNNLKKYYPSCKIRPMSAKGFYNEDDLEGVDLLINATALGLKKSDPLIFNKNIFRKGLAVYDLVYNPPTTGLIQIAKKMGLEASNGIGMLLYQGARSFELWTGKRAPIAYMRKALHYLCHPVGGRGLSSV